MLSCGIPLLFAAFTRHAWEDFYITLRSSRNLIEGHGLVFNPGNHVHAFTSPLGVLIPAGCLWAARLNDETALWFFRIICVALLAAGYRVLWSTIKNLRVGGVGTVLLFGLLLTDAKITDFAINGMETGILVFFVILLWSELESAAPRTRWIAAAIAGLMWTRPDAFIIVAALFISHFVFGERGSSRRGIAKYLAKGLGLGLLLYAPWIIWAWWYYGTPVPHTIIAKSAFAPSPHFWALLSVPWSAGKGFSPLDAIFMPAYYKFGGWPAALEYLAHGMSLAAAVAWMLPGVRQAGRRASLAVFLGFFYLSSINLFPWYLGPWTLLSCISLAFTVDAIHGMLAKASAMVWSYTLNAAVGFLIVIQCIVLVAVMWQMAIQQRLIEDGERREIGLWLRKQSRPQNTVFLEPLGYIGYFSNLRTYDFPGLSSPEVVATIKAGNIRFGEIISKLRPTWLVLRRAEVTPSQFPVPTALADYERVETWSCQEVMDSLNFLPGRGWLEFDAEFQIYHRKG